MVMMGRDNKFHMETTYQGYTFTDDKKLINPVAAHNLLSKTYWAKNRTLATVKKSIDHSLNFAIFHDQQQIGFGRVITDYATYASLLDIVIEENHRGQGLGKKLMEFIMQHPDIKNIKKILWTKDAEGLYQKYDFKFNPEMKVLFQYPQP